MLSFAAAFCTGAWLLQQQPLLPGVLWSYALLPLAFALLALRRPRSASRLWPRRLSLLCMFAAGFLWAALLAHLRLAQSLPLEWEGRDVTVTGVVAELPQRTERGLRFRFDLERVHTPLATLPSTLAISWYRDEAAQPPELHAGQRWRLTLRLRRPHGTSNPAGFDGELWMLERGIRAIGSGVTH